MSIKIGTETSSSDTVKIPISVYNNPGICSLKIKIKYDDSILTLKNIELNIKEFGENFTACVPYSNPQVISFVSPFKEIKYNGSFAILEFKISGKAKDGDIAKIIIDISKDDIFDYNLNTVSANIINGEVRIRKNTKSVYSVSIDDLDLKYKSLAKIVPDINADNGTDYTVSYSSSNNNILSVDQKGNVYGAKCGNATIVCTVKDSNGKTISDNCNVNVNYSFGQWLIKILLFGWIWY